MKLFHFSSILVASLAMFLGGAQAQETQSQDVGVTEGERNDTGSSDNQDSDVEDQGSDGQNSDGQDDNADDQDDSSTKAEGEAEL